MYSTKCDCYIIDGQNEWIYYSNADDDSSIYRMRTDGADKKKLNNDYSSNIQAVGEWLYYLKGRSGYPKIYRIPINGIAVFNDDGGNI